MLERARALRSPLAPPPTPALLLVAAALFVLSGGVLWALGLNYDGLTGAAASKVHPGTYGTCLLVAWQMLRAGNPIAYVAVAARTWPATFLFLAATVVLFLHIAIGGRHNMAGTIDTFMLPALLVVVTSELDAAARAQLERLIHAAMIVNALLGLLEFVLNLRFFPFVIDGETFPLDTRSSALQGHPLANATLTACYVLILLSGAGVLLHGRVRAAIIMLGVAALVTFGGRSAILVTLLVGGVQLLRLGYRRLRHGRVSLVTAAIVLLAGPSVLGLGTALSAAGFFTPLLARFESDGGSAEARVLMFDLVGQVPWRDLLVGPDPAFIDAIRLTAGLEQGIENPIVSFLLYQGLIVTGLMLATFALFVWEVAHRRARGTALPILGFLFLVNTFEGLAGKSDLLAKFILMLVAFYPPRAPSADARSVSRRASSSAS